MSTPQELTLSRSVLKITPQERERIDDCLIREERYRLFVNGEERFVFYCLPRDIKELALGYCFTHGILRDLSRLDGIDEGDGSIFLSINDTVDFTGDTGSTETVPAAPPAKTGAVFSPEDVHRLRAQFEERGELFRMTGCVHACALADRERLLLYYEDVSRRNALEKTLGAMRIRGIAPEGKMLIFSGRLALDMVMAAVTNGVRFLAAPSATTAAAVDFADREGVTLLAFIRGTSITVYTHPENIR